MSDETERRYYDAETAASRLVQATRVVRHKSRFGIFRRVLSGAAGFFSPTLLGPALAFGSIGLVLLGVFYGPLALYGVGLLSLAGIGYYVHRKVGRHIQFSEQKFRLRLLAILPAFGIMLLIIFGLLYISGRL